MILCLALRLYPLAVCGCNGIDMLSHIRRADKGHRLDSGIGHEDLRFRTVGGHQVHDSLREFPFLVKKFQHPDGSERRLAVGLQHHGIAAGKRKRNHPAPRNHRREVHRDNTRYHAQRETVTGGIIAPRHIHGGIALNHGRKRTSLLGRLNCLLYISSGFIQRFPQFLGAENGEFLLMRIQNLSPFKEILHPFGNGQPRPRRKSRLCGSNRLFALRLCALRYLRNDLSGRRIRHLHVFPGRRCFPLSVHTITVAFHFCHNPLLSFHSFRFK